MLTSLASADIEAILAAWWTDQYGTDAKAEVKVVPGSMVVIAEIEHQMPIAASADVED